MHSFKNSSSKPYRPPALIQPASTALEGLRRRSFALGHELKLKPFMVKDRAHVMFGEPVFDRLSADQLDHLNRSLEAEIAERKRVARRTSEIIEETAKKAAAAAVPARRSGLRGLADTTIQTNEPAFAEGGPSRFAIGIERMDRGQDVRTGKPLATKPRRPAPLSEQEIADLNHPILTYVRARFPNAQIVRNVSTRRAA